MPLLRCPDAQFCEAAWNASIVSLLPIIDLNMDYIARQLVPSNITCPHGPTECVGDAQQLCAQLMADPSAPSAQWWSFATCQSATRNDIPGNGAACAKQAGLDAGLLDACVSSVGSNLLYYSGQRAIAAKQGVSCTITLNDQQWCQHDSTWKGCAEGNDGPSLVRAICKRYTGATLPAVCKEALAEEQRATPSKHYGSKGQSLHQ